MLITKWVVHNLIYSPISLIGLCTLFPWSTIATAATLENLQAAYNRETNAHTLYLAFAERAKAEGYGGVASLFRAAARAEEIHAVGIQKAIVEMETVPHKPPNVQSVRTTRENLFVSSKDESCQRINYLEYIRQAKLDGNKHAIESFSLALAGESEQASLFMDAILTLDCMNGLIEASYFVCPTCGFITREAALSRCPTCLRWREGFELVV